MMKPYIVCFALFLSVLAGARAQIVTAEDYLGRVADKYAGFNDYEASIVIRQANSVSQGKVSHLKPQFLRIDFTQPAGQVIVFNGEQLTVYLPEFSAILNQTVAGGRAGANMATAAGLSLLRRGYAPAYLSSPSPVPLETGELAVKMRLSPRSGGQSYKEIILSINPDTLLVRRIEGTGFSGANVSFDFTNIKVNQGIPAARFVYDSPASANVYNNFLFRDSE